MTPNEKELTERYIYQVVRRLPKNQRDEVGMELYELIGDMYEEQPDIEKVLEKLGDPSSFAKQYGAKERFLIGPEYFDTYMWFVKVVLICAAVPLLAVSAIEGFTNYGEMYRAVSVIFSMIRALPEIFGTCIGIFGGLTAAFAVFEYNKIQIDIDKSQKWSAEKLKNADAKKWTVKDLEPVPDKKAVISRSESIVAVVFTVIFCVLIIFAPNLFSMVVQKGETVSMVPLFNLEEWNMIMPFFVLSLITGMADEIVRLAVGRYCKTVMISSIVCGGLQICFAAVVLKVMPFWNPDIAAEIQAATGDGSLGSLWNLSAASDIILAIMTVITLLEVGTTVFKTLKYGKVSA